MAAYEKALAIDPRNTSGMDNIGQAYRLVAQYESEHGGDPTPALDASIASFERALRTDPELAIGWRNLAKTALRRAEVQSKRGVDPHAGLAEVLQFIERLPGNHKNEYRQTAKNQLK